MLDGSRALLINGGVVKRLLEIKCTQRKFLPASRACGLLFLLRMRGVKVTGVGVACDFFANLMGLCTEFTKKVGSMCRIMESSNGNAKNTYAESKGL